MTRVLIAVDGSDFDTQLANAAHQLFGADADYWAVNVQHSLTQAPEGAHAVVPPMYAGALVGYGVAYPFIPPRPYDSADVPSGVDGDRSSQRDAEARAAAESAGIDDAAVIAEVGDPPTAILAAAAEHECDVVVVGSRDRSWWSKLIEPSVSGDVIEESPVPVLVVSEGPLKTSLGAATD